MDDKVQREHVYLHLSCTCGTMIELSVTNSRPLPGMAATMRREFFRKHKGPAHTVTDHLRPPDISIKKGSRS